MIQKVCPDCNWILIPNKGISLYITVICRCDIGIYLPMHKYNNLSRDAAYEKYRVRCSVRPSVTRKRLLDRQSYLEERCGHFSRMST